jgi:hypothetical protein
MDVLAPLVTVALIGGALIALGLAASAWGVDSRPTVTDDHTRSLDRSW